MTRSKARNPSFVPIGPTVPSASAHIRVIRRRGFPCRQAGTGRRFEEFGAPLRRPDCAAQEGGNRTLLIW